jgi:hypothetical protein
MDDIHNKFNLHVNRMKHGDIDQKNVFPFISCVMHIKNIYIIKIGGNMIKTFPCHFIELIPF